jgi:asparagine synthase (glutamine-hydrolysing)
MCGINGILRLRPEAPAIDRDELRRTRDAMAARGPDGAGEWLSPAGQVALGHRRLAILDPSPAGAQPMASAVGRFHIIVNGEIYNFRDLRRRLEEEGVRLRSHSDTEVVVELYARLGTAALPLLRGMYALAIWDEAAQRLLLARDPLGIKPLYYTSDGGCLRFASQVKALEASGRVERALDPAGLAGFLVWGSVPEPLTIRRGVRALPAGHHLLVDRGAVQAPRAHGAPGLAGGEAPTLAEAVADSVRAHLVSDVPVAVFLSAGVDSSLVAALACRELREPPVTFTLSFDVLADTPLDEGPLAAATARRLGTRHREQRVGRADFTELWPRALHAMDQPSIDGFNVFVISQAAHRAGLKVVLTGLGGDELFGSYPSFRDVPRTVAATRRAARLPGLAALWPSVARRLFAERPKLGGLLRHGAALPGAYFLRRGLFLPEELPGLIGAEAAAAGLAGYDPIADAARHLAGLPGGGDDDPWLAVHRMESGQYMRNQLLRDADWAAMAHSLELRTPLVDPVLHAALQARGFQPVRSTGKAALARALAPELPAEIFRRRKSGFYVPVAEWLAGPGTPPGRRGLSSRALALRLLAEWGCELPLRRAA